MNLCAAVTRIERSIVIGKRKKKKKEKIDRRIRASRARRYSDHRVFGMRRRRRRRLVKRDARYRFIRIVSELKIKRTDAASSFLNDALIVENFHSTPLSGLTVPGPEQSRAVMRITRRGVAIRVHLIENYCFVATISINKINTTPSRNVCFR